MRTVDIGVLASRPARFDLFPVDVDSACDGPATTVHRADVKHLEFGLSHLERLVPGSAGIAVLRHARGGGIADVAKAGRTGDLVPNDVVLTRLGFGRGGRASTLGAADVGVRRGVTEPTSGEHCANGQSYDRRGFTHFRLSFCFLCC